LEPLGLTYTSYITLMSFWEQDNLSVKELGIRLFLDSGTLTPLLKKMESQGLIKRRRGEQDERNVYIKLTKAGRELEQKCKDIPQKMMCSNIISHEDAIVLVGMLHKLMNQIK
ncbi:MAG: MarR family transcriptional regulator, partial [Spirochaetales bacterium]|nr:MarR family transcriptional regulator [Spirochaetales bacterium]